MNELEKKRHSLAHLLAAATLKIYPNTKITLGPAVDNGFYYDMDFVEPINDKDLKSIQKTMKKMANSWSEFTSEQVSPEKAREVFAGNEYKIELINEIEARGEDITLYTSGEFTDLCAGPHIPSTGMVKALKLTKTSAAYWRGDAKNDSLQRIYGISYPDKKSLDEFVKICDKFTNKKIFKRDSDGKLIKDSNGNLSKINDDNL